MLQRSLMRPPDGGRIVYAEDVELLPSTLAWKTMLLQAAPNTKEDDPVLAAEHLFQRPRSAVFSIAYLNFATAKRSSCALEFAATNGWYPASVYHVSADLINSKVRLRDRFGLNKAGILATVSEGGYACGFGWSPTSSSKGSLWVFDQLFELRTWFAFITEPWE